MSVDARLLSLLLRHHLHILRFGNQAAREIVELLNTTDRDIVDRLAIRLSRIEERGIDLGPQTTARLTALLDEIRALNEAVFQRVEGELTTALDALAQQEGDWHADALNVATATTTARLPAPALLASIATTRPITGTLLQPFVRGVADGRLRRVEKAVRIGMVEGQGVDAIVRRIRGTRAGGYRDGVLDISRRSAQALVRTAVSHTANHAAQETWRANSDLIRGWRFTATLDSRTTIVCASNDNRVFRVGEGPVPPLHPNCRSFSTAVTNRTPDLDPDDTRASRDGPVAANLSFEAWLKGQSPAVQLDVLGRSRLTAWRAGRLTLRDFVRDGRETLTLDELRRLHPSAFPLD